MPACFDVPENPLKEYEGMLSIKYFLLSLGCRAQSELHAVPTKMLSYYRCETLCGVCMGHVCIIPYLPLLLQAVCEALTTAHCHSLILKSWPLPFLRCWHIRHCVLSCLSWLSSILGCCFVMFCGCFGPMD